MYCQRQLRAGEVLLQFQCVYIDGTDSENIKKTTANTLLGSGVLAIVQADTADDDSVGCLLFGETTAIIEGAAELGDVLQCSATAGALEKIEEGGIPVAFLNVPLKRGVSGGTNTDVVDGQEAQVFFFGGMALPPAKLRGVKTHDFAALADGARGTTTLTVAGAVVGDAVVVNAVALEAGLVVRGYVSAANTVTLVLDCFLAAGVDAASQDFIVTVFKQSTVGA